MADIFVRVDELAGYAASYSKLAQESSTTEYAGARGADAAGAASLGRTSPR